MDLLDAIVMAHRTYRRKYERSVVADPGTMGGAVDPRWLPYDEGDDDDGCSHDSGEGHPSSLPGNLQQQQLKCEPGRPEWANSGHVWMGDYDFSGNRQMINRDPNAPGGPYVNPAMLMNRGNGGPMPQYDPTTGQAGFRYASPPRLDPSHPQNRMAVPPNIYLGAQGGNSSMPPGLLAGQGPYLARGPPTINTTPGHPHLEEAMILERMRFLTGTTGGVHSL